MKPVEKVTGPLHVENWDLFAKYFCKHLLQEMLSVGFLLIFGEFGYLDWFLDVPKDQYSFLLEKLYNNITWILDFSRLKVFLPKFSRSVLKKKCFFFI